MVLGSGSLFEEKLDFVCFFERGKRKRTYQSGQRPDCHMLCFLFPAFLISLPFVLLCLYFFDFDIREINFSLESCSRKVFHLEEVYSTHILMICVIRNCISCSM